MLNRTTLFCCLLFPALPALLSADTIPGGTVSGTWVKANSPYYITGDLTIPEGDTLAVEPGVSVIFQGNYGLTAVGLLTAIGTADDSIRFFPADTSAGWQGIDIQSVAALPHRLSYCTFSHGFNGIASEDMVDGLNADISHCCFRRNIRALYWESLLITDLKVSDCAFRDNGPVHYGAAIHLLDVYGPVEVTGCLFENNAADFGGAMYMNQCYLNDIRISGCTFLDNTADSSGGAIYAMYIEDITVMVEHCTFGGNTAKSLTTGMGGGAVWGSGVHDFRVSYCSFYGNYAYDGASVYASHLYGDADFTLDHCTFRGSGTVEVIGGANSAATLDVTNCIFAYCEYAIHKLSNITLTVKYSDFYGNSSEIAIPPSGFGVLDRVNANGDPCDQYYNIFLDPLFADTANHDFHLTEGSPCIDAGDPAFACDPDSTITDLGAFYYDSDIPVVLSSFTALPVPGGVLVSWTTASERDNLGFNVLRSGREDSGFIKVNGMLVPGAGTTAQPRVYSYTDSTVPAGTWYYRLEQVDSGGGRVLSPAVSVTVPPAGMREPASVWAADLSLAQTPAREVRLALPFAALVAVYDGYGLAVVPARPVARGSVFRYVPETPGIYLVRVAGPGKPRMFKFAVIR